MTKKEILKQMKKNQRLQNEQNNQETKILNPNYKKGKPSFNDIYNGINTKKYLIVDF